MMSAIRGYFKINKKKNAKKGIDEKLVVVEEEEEEESKNERKNEKERDANTYTHRETGQFSSECLLYLLLGHVRTVQINQHPLTIKGKAAISDTPAGRIERLRACARK